MTALRSRKYLAGSRGAPCSLRIAGVCTGDTETTIPAHIRDRHTGRSIKASDMSVADACQACHDKFDGRSLPPLSAEDWLFYALRGLQDTIERRRELGLLFVPEDAAMPHHDKPVKARKPRAERRPMPKGKRLESGSTFPPGRKIESRNTLRKEPI